ncbi:hypothetical protein Ahy_A08g041303 isoform A [Arachis hypogaea]|uniref:J domain-containing protein n=1 Tax=Arachis hypogaea TaxID=3818 RepID=A0A445C2B2_ARAHY|nr:hypothetical protein Ahy_A08g041303 isoform A [Arachis hypogaea]
MPPSSPSMASTLRAYALPLILFAFAMLYQLLLIPNYFPPSHYDVLKIDTYSPVDKVRDSYHTLQSNWNSSPQVPDTCQFLKIQYAYELLTNPSWKRDYDLFGIDDQLHILENASKNCAGKRISELDLPLLDVPPPSGPIDHSHKVITALDFQSIFPVTKPWLIQLYSSGSKRCAQFSESWNKIASLLHPFANTGMVELGEVQLAVYLADKRSTGKPYFRNGIPYLLAIPPGCRDVKCFSRFDGELTVDKVTNWFATTVLALPQINYYSKESLVPKLFGKSSHHKVKVIFFTKSGERAAPFIRQAAKDYWDYASFAFILWREEESSYWMGAFGVESAPAVVFLKDPGVKPVVHHGSVDNSFFLKMMENNKQQELPQLRSVTSMELGCDPHGYSRAGYDTIIWYCAIAVGRPGLALNKMREVYPQTMCRVKETLSKPNEADASSDNQTLAPAVEVIKRKRLTFAWLDGEKQKDFCRFYLGPASEQTCGQHTGVDDIPQLFIIRYLRNSSAMDTKTQEKPTWKSLLMKDLEGEHDQAGQFVARYKGASDISEISQWIASIIKDGDTRELPFFTLRTPALVPDDKDPGWSRTAQKVPLENLKQRIQGVVRGLLVYQEDPRIGPFLLLGALISMGSIWFRRNQAQTSESNPQSQPSSEEPSQDERNQRPRDGLRRRQTKDSTKNQHPSMTDSEPKGAYQIPLSDSESE